MMLDCWSELLSKQTKMNAPLRLEWYPLGTCRGDRSFDGALWQ